MIIAAFCPACAEERARTSDLPVGQRPTPADFIPVPGQEVGTDGEPAKCFACQASLVFRRIAPASANGHATSAPPRVNTPGVTTLFALETGEEIKATRELGTDLIVIFTNRRIVRINLNELLETP